MIEQFTNEEFLKPVFVVFALILMLVLLRKINKVLLIVGVIVLSALYLLNNRPDWLEAIWQNFQI